MSWSKTFTGDTRRRQVVALQRALGCSRALAVGWDAMVRDLATEHDGDLTGWADEDLEAAVLWDGAPGELAAALRTSGVLVEGDGAVRPDSWAERQGSVHERDRKRSWRSSRRGGRDGDGTVPGPSRDTDGTVPGLSQPPSPPLPAPSLSLPTPLSDSPPLPLPPTAAARGREPSGKTGELSPAAGSEPSSPAGELPGHRRPDPASRAAALESVFVEAWNARVAGRGQHRQVLMLDGLARARLADAELDAAGVEQLVDRVAGSKFLLGLGSSRFKPSPRWLAEHAAKILAGEYDDDQRQLRVDLLGPWLGGWRRVEASVEASSERTRARDLALSALLEVWSATEATRSWVTERAAEGAARELAARRATSKTSTTLDELVRRGPMIEEVMRAGEARMRPALAPAPVPLPAAPAPPVPPAEILAGLRAKQRLIGLRPAEASRLAELEREVEQSPMPPSELVRGPLAVVQGGKAAGA